MSATGNNLQVQQPAAGLCLVFAVGERPAADDIERLLAAPADPAMQPAIGAQVSLRPADSADWLELLASGLAFDLTGLAPGAADALPEAAHLFGITRPRATSPAEAITLAPGPHIAGGSAMIPIVRVMTGLAAALALALPVRAVCWRPAGCWMEPAYFARIVDAWLAGGAFPALGLTGLERAKDGSVTSNGLAFFIGQELRVEARAGESAADTAKLAARVIDELIRHGPLDEDEELVGRDGEALLAQPSQDGRLVVLRRNA